MSTHLDIDVIATGATGATGATKKRKVDQAGRKTEAKRIRGENEDAVQEGQVKAAEGQVINQTGLNRSKKTFTKRPVAWRSIGQYYEESGGNMATTLKEFENDLQGKTETAKYQAVTKYAKEWKHEKEPTYEHMRYSILGKDIEQEIYDEYLIRRGKGLSIGTDDIQLMAKEKIKTNGMEILYTRGYTFGRSWVQRWCARWKISSLK
jgi:hypothetical protein